MEGQETDVGHQPQEHPNPFLSVSHYHHRGETKAPGPMLLMAQPTCSPTPDSGTAELRGSGQSQPHCSMSPWVTGDKGEGNTEVCRVTPRRPQESGEA